LSRPSRRLRVLVGFDRSVDVWNVRERRLELHLPESQALAILGERRDQLARCLLPVTQSVLGNLFL
jgi:hypothetical protein